MPYDPLEPIDSELNLSPAEESVSPAGSQDTEADDWDFWNSEYWIVRDRPPYRV